MAAKSKVNDFLFQGKPPPNVDTSSVQTTAVPAYLQQYHEGILARGNAIAAKPYQTYGAQRIAGIDPALSQGWDAGMAAANSWQPAFGQAGTSLNQAAQGNASGAAAPWLQKAGGISGTQAAQPGLQAAMQGSNTLVSGYMSPYMTGVVDMIAKKGQEALQGNLHTMGDDFIKAGQLGSSRHMSAAGKAMSDTQEAISNAQTTALNEGYQTALGAAQNDLSRFAQVGQAQGNLALGEQQNLGALGQMAGNFNSVDTRNALDTAAGFQALGKNTQAAGLTGAAAMEAVGRGKMGEEQKHLDLAYQDFVDQREYPRNNVDWLASLTKGQPNMGGSVYTDSSAPLSGAQYQPSGLQQIAGSLSLLSAFGKAKGGRIDKNAKPNKTIAVKHGPALSMMTGGREEEPALSMMSKVQRPRPIRVRRAA